LQAFQFNEIIEEDSKKFCYAFFSDLHFDVPHCDRKQLKSDLDWCMDNGYKMIFNGDLLDAILLRDSKRAVNSRVSSRDAQINEKVNEIVDFLTPYVENIIYMGQGNHETSVWKYSGVDVLDWIVVSLNRLKKNGLIVKGGYQGFLRLSYAYKGDKSSRLTYDIFIHHGSGMSAAPITKGMIDFDRMIKSTLADLYVLGHKHNAIHDYSIPLTMLTQKGRVVTKNRRALMTPSYSEQVILNDEINFEDNFYGRQAACGFGLLIVNLQRVGEAKERCLEVDTSIVNRSIKEHGNIVDIQRK
jgi:hypothetical protein